MIKKLLYISIVFSFFPFTQQALAQGVGEENFVGPGGCTTQEECQEYCDLENNKEECLTFAVVNGMMTQDEADRARKFLSQTGPGGCKGDECKTYCDEPANIEDCLSFAEKSGLIRPGEAERFRKMRAITERGGPGGCKGEECRKYCEEESRRSECFAFAKENNLLTQEQIEGFEIGQKINQQIKETGGPGGCKSEDECHKYCSNLSNIDECAVFGAQHTGKSTEEIRRMLERFNKEGFQGEGPGMPEGFQERRDEFERRLRDEAGFREKMMQGGYETPSSFEGPAMGEFRGPGGCDSPQSCQQYCMSNPQDCGFIPSLEGAQIMPPTTLPSSEPESRPTSYDHSRSFLANIWSAFLLPFKD